MLVEFLRFDVYLPSCSPTPRSALLDRKEKKMVGVVVDRQILVDLPRTVPQVDALQTIPGIFHDHAAHQTRSGGR